MLLDGIVTNLAINGERRREDHASRTPAGETPLTATNVTSGGGLEALREEIGPLAEALAINHRFGSEHARAELGWNPPDRDVRAELAAR